MRHKKKVKKWVILGGGILLSLVLIWVTSRNRDFSWIEKSLKNFFYTVESIVQEPFTKEGNTIDFTLSQTKEKELQELQSLLSLKTLLSDFDTIYATTISRNVSYWQENITIDCGSKDGIEKGMAVITSFGLVGKVDKVTDNFSEVKLLTASKDTYQVSVVIASELSYYGVLSQYDVKAQTFLITGIPASATLKEGDVVSTSGLGGIFPSGLFVGRVVSAVNDPYGITKTITISPDQDFNQVKYVAVVKRNGDK